VQSVGRGLLSNPFLSLHREPRLCGLQVQSHSYADIDGVPASVDPIYGVAVDILTEEEMGFGFDSDGPSRSGSMASKVSYMHPVPL
jgi:hypothetical protein